MEKNSQRQDYIDWLRVGAMILLVFYHTGRLFDAPDWHIKNIVLNEVINNFNRFLDIWHMPLFFLLAGASVWFSLGNRSATGFVKERVLRLFVPLIFGMLIIVPPQVYIERIFDGDFSGSFWAWYPHTFTGTYSMENAATGNLSWHHLWFLVYLFVFSLILVPIFWYFRKGTHQSLISRIAAFLTKPGMIFLPVIPLIICNLTLRPIYGYGNQNLISDWANFCFYLTIFFYGFMLVSDKRILEIIQNNRNIALTSAIACLVLTKVLEANYMVMPPFIMNNAWKIILTLDTFACWFWLMVIIGIGSRLLKFSNTVLKYASNVVMPVYVVHQTLIVVLGYFIIQWNIDVPVKYLLIITATLFISVAIYEIAKRTSVSRFLFGIKAKKSIKTVVFSPTISTAAHQTRTV